MAGVPFWISGIMIHPLRNTAGLLVRSRRMGNSERALSTLGPMLKRRDFLSREGVLLMRTGRRHRDGVGPVTPKVQEEVSQTEEKEDWATSPCPLKASPRMCTTERTFSLCSCWPTTHREKRMSCFETPAHSTQIPHLRRPCMRSSSRTYIIWGGRMPLCGRTSQSWKSRQRRCRET